MSRRKDLRTTRSTLGSSKLSSSSQLSKIHHLLLLQRHQGVGLHERSSVWLHHPQMCWPRSWTWRLVNCVFSFVIFKNSKLDKSENVSFTLFSISVNAGTNVIKICRLPAQKLAEAIVLAQLLVNHNFFPLMSTRISLLFHFDNV